MSNQLELGRARRRAADRRSCVIARAASAANLRHTLTLIQVLADLGALSDALPYAGVKHLAREIGIHPGTVRRQTRALENAGLLIVYRAKPHKDPFGLWTRPTNRYLLCDRRAGGVAARARAARNLPKRKKPQVAPSAHPCALTPTGRTSGGAQTGAAPPPWYRNEAENEPPGDHRAGLAAVRAALKGGRQL